MGFKTDGSSHQNGVENEKEICGFLKEHVKEDPLQLKKMFNLPPESTISFEHGGGTKSVSDMNIYVDNSRKIGTSLKRHKRGTFDHVNSGAAFRDLLPTKTVDQLMQIKNDMEKQYFQCSPEKKVMCNKRLNEAIDSSFDGVSSDPLIKIMNYIHQRTPELVVVNDCKGERLVAFKGERLEELSVYPNSGCEYFLKKKRNAKLSRSIFRRTSDGQEIDTNLRLRIVLNNGISALLGLSPKNKKSVFCIKIQQDNVDKLLSSIEPHSSCSYGSN